MTDRTDPRGRGPASPGPSATVTGMAVAAVLGVVAVTLGVGEMLVVALFVAVGALVGRVASGRTDLGRVWDALRGRRSSS